MDDSLKDCIPCNGVLMAALSEWARNALLSELILGSFLYLPKSVLVYVVLWAISIVLRCHSFTSGLLLYQRSRVSSAS